MDPAKVKSWLARCLARVPHLRSDADWKDELQAHLDLYEEDSLGAGLKPSEARRQAHLSLGDPQVVLEAVRDQEVMTMLESWYRDLSLGLRALRKSPLFCLTAVLTLAIGIGANTAVFTLLYGLLLRSLPADQPQNLVRIGVVTPSGPTEASSMPYWMLQELKKRQQSYTGISAWSRASVNLEDESGVLRLYQAGLVSGNGFEVLGMSPRLGRLLIPSDDVRGGPSGGWPVVLSYGFWQDRFGGDPQIVGRSLRVSESIVTIVGVAPRDFMGVWPGGDPKLYFPLQYVNVVANQDLMNTPTSFWFCSTIGRRRPGVTLAEANSEIAVYEKQLMAEFIPPAFQRSRQFREARLRVESARAGLPTFFGRVYTAPLFLMQGLVAIVLLLCCVNVSGLMMSKIYERQHEFAVRTAIGAARWRLIRQYLTESFVIALAGAALGSAIAWYGSGVLQTHFRDPNMFSGMSVQPDSMVFWATSALAVLTTLFFGILPAWRAGGSDPGILLKSRTVGARRQIAGRMFVPLQVSVSLVLVTLAGLLSQSLIRVQGEHRGFDVDHVTIQTPPFNRLPQKREARLDMYQKMVDRMEQSPGFRSAAVTWYTPMTGSQATAGFRALSDAADSPEDPKMAYNDVGPGYFRTMETKILQGREFAKNERTRDVCVVNESAAEFLFPREAVLGRYVQSADVKTFPKPFACRVIGVAEDAKFATLRDKPPRTVYFPVSVETVEGAGNLVFLMNSPSKAQSIRAYREALSEIAPTVPLVLFATLREQMDASLGSQVTITMLSNFFAGLALLLSAIGLYGLLSSSVVQRRPEIGVRVALGASRHSVLRMVLSDAFRLVAAGMVAGGVLLFLAVRFVQNMLYGVTAFDPVTLIGAAALLLGVALLAGLLPALRAASVDPIQALRAE